MALKEHDIKNFETLKAAFDNNDVGLLECKDAETGEYRAAICAFYRDGDEIVGVPFAILPVGNPYDTLIPATGGQDA